MASGARVKKHCYPYCGQENNTYERPFLMFVGRRKREEEEYLVASITREGPRSISTDYMMHSGNQHKEEDFGDGRAELTVLYSMG